MNLGGEIKIYDPEANVTLRGVLSLEGEKEFSYGVVPAKKPGVGFELIIWAEKGAVEFSVESDFMKEHTREFACQMKDEKGHAVELILSRDQAKTLYIFIQEFLRGCEALDALDEHKTAAGNAA